MLEVDKKAVDEIRSNIELLVKVVNLPNPLLISLARASKFTEKSGQLTELCDKDSDSEDDNQEDPTQFKATGLGYVSVTNCSDGYY